jgi:hypothetical protein
MQITADHSGMTSLPTAWTDVEGRMWCVVVVKASFVVGADEQLQQLAEPATFVFADEYHGEPGLSSLRFENDFAPIKPQTDVVVVGRAHAPGGRPTSTCDVALQVGGRTKVVRVHGPRVWTPGVAGLVPSRAQPFEHMPLVWELAYGGTRAGRCEWDNPVGIGLAAGLAEHEVVGTPAPSLELPDQPVVRWGPRVTPANLGPIARAWHPRLGHAGTYDAAWKAERFPFLPVDFDLRHFQIAPLDQRFDRLASGTRIACINLDPTGRFAFTLPEPPPTARFRFRDRDEVRPFELDTVIIESEHRRVTLAWRTRMQLGRKLTSLRGIEIGVTASVAELPRKRGKPWFRSLGEFVRWRKGRS